ncbi:mCG1051114 [Mus musculus]|jgi:hypothetical protein|nr:mCG1051114 [Mus musculus]
MPISKMSPSFHVTRHILIYQLSCSSAYDLIGPLLRIHHFLIWHPAWNNTHFITENIPLCQINKGIIIFEGRWSYAVVCFIAFCLPDWASHLVLSLSKS